VWNVFFKFFKIISLSFVPSSFVYNIAIQDIDKLSRFICKFIISWKKKKKGCPILNFSNKHSFKMFFSLTSLNCLLKSLSSLFQWIRRRRVSKCQLSKMQIIQIKVMLVTNSTFLFLLKKMRKTGVLDFPFIFHKIRTIVKKVLK